MTQDPRETTVDEPHETTEETVEPTAQETEALTQDDGQRDAEAEIVEEEMLDENQWQTGPIPEDAVESEETLDERDDSEPEAASDTEPTDEEDLDAEEVAESKAELAPDREMAAEQTDEDEPVGCAPHTETTDEEMPAESADIEAESNQETSEDESELSEAATTEEEAAASEQVNEVEEPAEEEQPVTVESVVEAILFASDEPLTDGRLAKIVETTGGQVRKCIEALNAKYETNHNAFRIEQIAGGYQMLTLSAYNQWLGKMLRVRSDTKLSPAAMETLAIIAYKQPVIRVDIEAIRGVAVGEVIRSLMYKGLVKIVGRAEILGRPMLYGTTKKFLEVFGLNSLKDLPKAEELKNPD